MSAGPLPIPKDIPKFGSERLAVQTKAENQTEVPKGQEISAADAFGLGLIDKGTLGLLPWIHDKLVDLAGQERMGPKYVDTVIPNAATQHPIAAGLGGAAGMVLPMGFAARGLQAAGVGSRYLLGAGGAVGGDVADQAVRMGTENRDFNPTQTAISGVAGAAGPLGAAALAHLPLAAATGALTSRLGKSALGGIYDFARNAARAAVPEAAAGAEATLSGEAAQASRATFDEAAAAAKRFRDSGVRADPPGTVKGEGFTMRPGAGEPTPVYQEPVRGPDVMQPKANMAGAGKDVPFNKDPFDFSPAPPPIRTQGPPRDPLDFSEFFEPKPSFTTPPPKFASGAPEPTRGAPFAGIRPSKLEPGSPMHDELSARIRAMATGQPLPPIQPPIPPAPPPPPPGLLDLPYYRLGTAATAEGGMGALEAIDRGRKTKRKQKARQ